MMGKTNEYLIVDCFVDEPACFGVPPFVAPYPRYVYGALRDAGIDPSRIGYLTIEQLRKSDFILPRRYDGVFVIGGAVVPGKYLHARIGTHKEISLLVERNHQCAFFIGGAVGRKMIVPAYRNAKEIQGDIEYFAYEFAKGNLCEGERTARDIAKWSVLGAPLVRLHPEFPHLICEIETYRGCPRQVKCSFCQEFRRRTISTRTQTEILNEIDALSECGISRFRIGCQPDIIQYGAMLDEFRQGIPRPNPKKVISLFEELKKRKTQYSFQLLCIDNANPATLAIFPDESADIINAIVEAITPGDTLALGIESFDENVIASNNLKASPQQSLFAVQLINKIGGMRKDGVPHLLPGINLLHGLFGERLNTFKINYEYLMQILKMGLLVRRINIRTVNRIEGTPLSKKQFTLSNSVRNRYEYFRQKIREEVEKPMLKKIFPAGTVMRNLRLERIHHGYSYARQIASYPIAVKIPYNFSSDGFFDAIVINHQERSIIALPLPIDINSLPFTALKQVPGISNNVAKKIIELRPFKNRNEIRNMFPLVPEWLL
ncbi:MAG: helix-hairpin-helix domain-containing protein [Spirochaetes bacterium]|nr:helix-hairpin-helix domain-containing protein [Spirochaetota bacterium]